MRLEWLVILLALVSGSVNASDQAQLQRGFKVYREVCATCHGLQQVRYRDLAAIGMADVDIRDLAVARLVRDGVNGRIASPYKNDAEARYINFGALPPDLSTIVRSRSGGANYIRALLLGYDDAPAGVDIPEGRSWNRAFSAHIIAMPPPLADGLVDYPEGMTASKAQMAEDVAAFLAWASDPHREDRQRMGLRVGAALLFIGALLYARQRRLWQV